ncbi:AMP-binding protein, partial [Pseudomonas sp. HY2-MNA-CIBAN-0224]
CTITQNSPDLNAYCANIEKEKATLTFLVPTILYRLLEIESDLSTLKYVVYGAAPMSPGKLKLLQAKLGNIFIQGYGSTEHFGFALNMSTQKHIIKTEVDEVRLGSAGQPTPSVECVIVDSEGNTLPQGETGELWVRSR